jgi:hypothetical protein
VAYIFVIFDLRKKKEKKKARKVFRPEVYLIFIFKNYKGRGLGFSQ